MINIIIWKKKVFKITILTKRSNDSKTYAKKSSDLYVKIEGVRYLYAHVIYLKYMRVWASFFCQT